MSTRTKATANKSSFAVKLYAMLDAVKKSGDDDVVAWLPHNRAFRIINEERFMNTVAPRYFDCTKIRSFTRQLNLWGFQR